MSLFKTGTVYPRQSPLGCTLWDTQLTDQGLSRTAKAAVHTGQPPRAPLSRWTSLFRAGLLIRLPPRPPSSVTHTAAAQGPPSPRKSRLNGWMFLWSYSDFFFFFFYLGSIRQLYKDHEHLQKLTVSWSLQICAAFCGGLLT